MPDTKSPCVNRCTTGLGDDVCRGCGRTWEQVRDWPALTEAEKAQVIDTLAIKKQSVSAASSTVLLQQESNT